MNLLTLGKAYLGRVLVDPVVFTAHSEISRPVLKRKAGFELVVGGNMNSVDVDRLFRIKCRPNRL